MMNCSQSIRANTSFWISKIFDIIEGKTKLIYFFDSQICQSYFLETKIKAIFFFHTNLIFISLADVTNFSWLFQKYSSLTILCTFLTIFIHSWGSSLRTLQMLNNCTTEDIKWVMFNGLAFCRHFLSSFFILILQH